MTGHVIEVHAEKDHETDPVNDQEDPTEEEVAHDRVKEDEIDPILEIVVIHEDMIDEEADHPGEEDDRDLHHHNTEADAEEDVVVSDADAAGVVAGVIEAAETKGEIIGVVMILMVSMANPNPAAMMIYPPMDSLLLHNLLIVEVVMVTVATMTEVDEIQGGTVTTVENGVLQIKLKNGQGSVDEFQTDLR